VNEVALPISERSDAELVRGAVAGTLDDFNVLVRRWERKIYNYVLRLVHQREDAFDLCQEVFISAFQRLDRLRDAEKFTPWLFRIAHNAAYSHLRGRGNPDRNLDVDPDLLELNSHSLAPGRRLVNRTSLEGAEVKMLVEKALAALPVEQREAIVLKVYEGLKFSEIGEIQGCPESTAKARVYAGYGQLKKLLQG
jgi:RNA polymerase sigma-70 factor, ECF subfamily